MYTIESMIRKKRQPYMVIGIALGATLGAAYGIIVGQIALGIAIGIGFGFTVGASLQGKRNTEESFLKLYTGRV